MAKQYLNVAYKDRDLAKRLGARWDASVKRWYCPAGSDLSKIFTWRAARRLETTAPRPAWGIPPTPSQNFELSLFS